MRHRGSLFVASLGCGILLFTLATPLPGQGRPLDWQFEEQLRLGTVLGAETKAFHRLITYAVAATADGDLYVLDRGNRRIQVFDSTGEFVRTIGHEGNGPGEFKNPVAIWNPDGASIAVFDRAPHRISTFTKEGEVIEDRAVPFSRDMFMYADGTRELYTMTEGMRTDSLGRVRRHASAGRFVPRRVHARRRHRRHRGGRVRRGAGGGVCG